MRSLPASLKWSRKTLVAVAYLGITVALGVQTVSLTWGHVQLFDALRQLQYRFDNVELRLEGEATAVVVASAYNPTGYDGMRVWSVLYVVFVNATDANFSMKGGPDAGEFGVREASYEAEPRTFPARGIFNLAFTLLPHPEIVEPMRSFVTAHPGQLRIFVGITLTLLSSFGFIDVPSCYEFSPAQPDFTLCPGLEVPPRTRFG